MNPLISRARRSARLILPAAALLTVMGSTAAVASPVQAGLGGGHGAAAESVKFTWHPLKLVNGWKSASTKKFVTGTPAWALSDGMVYLRGAIRQSEADSDLKFAMLPKNVRPTSNLYIQVFTKSAVPGILRIGSGGVMEAIGGDTEISTSLSAVSFQTTAVKSHQVKLLNGWQSSQSTFGTGNPSYAISNGVVHLSGSMNSPGSSPLAFILPKAARPAHTLFISVYTIDGASPGLVEILPQGEVDISGTGSAGYTSLANISFPVASTKWHKFTLQSGWKPFTKFDAATPAYAVVNGVVYLDGEMQQPTPGADLWTDIPAAMRTTDVLDVEVMTTSGSVGAVTMNSRHGLVGSTPAANAQLITSLSGVAYPAGS